MGNPLWRMKALYERFGYETMWVLLGFIGSSLALLGGTRMLTTFLSKREYGTLALAISLVNIFSFIIVGPLSGGVTRFFSIAEQQDGFGALGQQIRLWLGWSAGSMAATALLVLLITDVPATLIAATAVFSLSQMLNQTAMGIEEAARRRRVVAVLRIVFEGGRFALACALVVFWMSKGVVAMFGFALAGLATCVVHGVYLKKRLFPANGSSSRAVGTAGNETILKKFLPYILPLLISGLCAWPYLMLDRWCLKWFCGIDAAGLYSAVYQMGFVPATMAGNFLIILISPILFQHIGDGADHENKRKAFRANFLFSLMLLGAFLAGFLMLFFARDWVGHLLLGEAFRAGSWMLPWLFLSGGVYAVGQQLLLRVSGDMQTHKLALISLGMVVLAVGVYIAGAKTWGESGIVFGFLAVNIAFLCVATVLGRTD